MIIEATKDITSIGVLATQRQVSVRAIEQAAERLHITPAMRWNNVVQFDAVQVELIIKELHKDKVV